MNVIISMCVVQQEIIHQLLSAVQMTVGWSAILNYASDYRANGLLSDYIRRTIRLTG